MRILLTTPRALLERTRLPRALAQLRASSCARATSRRPRGARRAPRAHRLRARPDGGGRRAVLACAAASSTSTRSAWPSRCASSSGATRSSSCGTSTCSAQRSHARRRTSRSSCRSTAALDDDADGGERVSIAELLAARHDRCSCPDGVARRCRSCTRTWDEAAAPHRARAPPRRGRRARARSCSRRPTRRGRRAIGAVRHRCASTVAGRGRRRRRLPARAAGADRPRHPRAAPPRARRHADGHPLRQRRGSASGSTSCSASEERGAPSPRRRSSSACWAAASSIPPRRAALGLRVLTDHEIFRRERRIRRARRYAAGYGARRRASLKPGDYVVHLEHGVGIYRGIETMFVRESTIEVAVIEYEGGDRLNVPLYRIDQIERYRGAERRRATTRPPPRLHRLGGKRWAQQRDQTRAAIQEMTVELLELYARRKVARAPAARARHAVAAAARELVPVRGHARPAQGDRRREERTWRARARWTACSSATSATARRRSPCAPRSRRCRAGARSPCSCRRRSSPTSTRAPSASGSPTSRSASRCLSRFQTAKEQAAVLVELRGGEDRHRHRHAPAAQPRRRRSRDLGLIVVDEEHRFGVKHKERLKQLKLETDVLTLTATPIPRTLHHVARRPARHDADADAAARPLAGAHVRRAVGRRAHRGGHRARARSRRAGVLRPQPHRDHRGDRRSHSRASCRARASPSATAR